MIYSTLVLSWLDTWLFPLEFLAGSFVLCVVLQKLIRFGKRPEQPWLDRRDWAAGRIRYTDSIAGTLLAIFAAAFTAMVIASFFTHPPVVMVIVLPAIAVILDWKAIRLVRSASRYGRSVLELKTVPAVPGGALTGTIRISHPFIYREPITLHLACIWHDDRMSTPVVTTIWQVSESLDRYKPGSLVSQLPVHFEIPSQAKPTQVNRYDRIEWKLDIKAISDGPPYSAWFVVPVFLVASDVQSS